MAAAAAGRCLQVHEMISVTAIQEAQQSAVAAFEDFMDACMDSEWQQARGGDAERQEGGRRVLWRAHAVP